MVCDGVAPTGSDLFLESGEMVNSEENMEGVDKSANARGRSGI